MLRIYPLILDVLRKLHPVFLQIARHDSDLARQARRAGASVALNVAEGMYSRGKNRAARYHTALGSMRETQSCLEVAVAYGYIHSTPDAVLGAEMHRIVGTLVRLADRSA